MNVKYCHLKMITKLTWIDGSLFGIYYLSYYWLRSSFLFQGGYPARLKKVLIVTAPLWFKAPFKILRLFVREKLRERVFTVSIPQLSLHVPRESLPVRLGGTLEVDHSSWWVEFIHNLISSTFYKTVCSTVTEFRFDNPDSHILIPWCVWCGYYCLIAPVVDLVLCCGNAIAVCSFSSSLFSITETSFLL